LRFDAAYRILKQTPDLAGIFAMLNDGKSQYAIAELIGKP